MKIIRWLLSHSFLILLIVAVIYGYMFWGNLLGKDTPAGKAVVYLSSEFVAVEKFVNAVKAKQAMLNGEQPPEHQPEQTSGLPAVAESAQAGADEIHETPQQVEPVTAGVVLRKEETSAPVVQPRVVQPRVVQQSENQTGEQSVNNSYVQEQANSAAAEVAGSKTGSENQLALMSSAATSQKDKLTDDMADVPQSASTEATSEATAEGTVLESNADLGQTEQTFVSPEIEKQLENVDKQGRIIDESKNGDTVKADWITARKSFYRRNYTLSEQSYQRVIENSEDNFDAYGELGNVYFNQGKNKQAASAYFQAAAILVRKGQVSRARSLMGLLHHLDKSKASDLQQLIDSAHS